MSHTAPINKTSNNPRDAQDVLEVVIFVKGKLCMVWIDNFDCPLYRIRPLRRSMALGDGSRPRNFL